MQKVKVKIDRYDTWSADLTLSYIILPILKQLQEDKHGSPFTDDDDVPLRLKSTSANPKENEHDTDEFHHQRWDYIMNEMIFAFEFQFKEELYSQEQTDIDDRERAKKGLALFGKYYNNLWD